jgi:alcohol dehydrogenase class IV
LDTIYLRITRQFALQMRYHLPTTIIFGAGKISEIGQLVREKLRATRPFLVTDRGIQEAGIVAGIRSQLPGIPIFDEVEPNPTHSTVNWGGALARQLNPGDILVPEAFESRPLWKTALRFP